MSSYFRDLYDIFHPVIMDGFGWRTTDPINEDTEKIGDNAYPLLLEKRMFQTPVTIIIRLPRENEKKVQIEIATGREIFTSIQKETAGRTFLYLGLQQLWPRQYLVEFDYEEISIDVDWVIGREVSSAKVLGKEPDTPANLNHVLFNEPVMICVFDEFIHADGGATLGEILSKINAIYDDVFDNESEDEFFGGYMTRIFEGFSRHEDTYIHQPVTYSLMCRIEPAIT